MNGINIDEKSNDIIKKELIRIVKQQLSSENFKFHIEPATVKGNCFKKNRQIDFLFTYYIKVLFEILENYTDEKNSITR